MKLRTALVALAFTVTACGGGGSSSTVPTAPAKSTPSYVTFALKVPTKAKQVRSQYVSPATLGVGINFAAAGATFTTAQLQTPNVPFDLSTCTQANSCTVNADGSQTYTLSASVPPGTYAFAVSTWDTAPSAGSFSGSMISESYVANQAVVAGSASTTIPLVLNAVPVSINAVPVSAQSHVQQTGTTFNIIGNVPVQFAVNALDADGYLITGSGAPAFAFTDSTGTFTASPVSAGSNVFNVQASSTASANSTISAAITATPPGGSGLPAASGTVTLAPLPEVWISQSGSGAVGIYGYALNNTTYAQLNVVDFIPTSFSAGAIAVDHAGNLWVVNGSQIQEFTPGVGADNWSQAAQFINQGATALAVDASGLLWAGTVDAKGGTVTAYNLASLSSGPVYQVGGILGTFARSTQARRPLAGISGVSSIAIAPTSASIPTQLSGSIWIAGTFGLDVLTISGSSLAVTYKGVLSGGQNAVAVSPNGTVWTIDTTSSTLTASSLSFTTSPVLTPEQTLANVSVAGEVGLDPGQNLWTNNTGGNAQAYTLSGCPASCGIFYGTSAAPGTATGNGVFVVP